MTFGATTAEQLNSSITFLTLGLGLMVVAPWFIFDPKDIKRSCGALFALVCFCKLCKSQEKNEVDDYVEAAQAGDDL